MSGQIEPIAVKFPLSGEWCAVNTPGYIILKGKESFALIAHARCNSIKVSKGDLVSEGQELAQVGHSGNSTAPHLHF